MFIHIPKTGGMSFEALLRDIYGDRFVCPFYADEELVKPVFNLPEFHVYQGHISYFISDVLPKPLEIVTFLRDPVVRAMSTYEHIRLNVKHPRHKIVAEETTNLADFAQHPLLRQDINNVQTRMLGRSLCFENVCKAAQVRNEYAETARLFLRFFRIVEPDSVELETAKQRLEGMNFFGVTERFDESWHLFLRTYGLPAFPARRLNFTPPEIVDGRDAYTDEEIEAVLSINQLDIQLYDYAVSLFNIRAG